jgi:hypothetical protein
VESTDGNADEFGDDESLTAQSPEDAGNLVGGKPLDLAGDGARRDEDGYRVTRASCARRAGADRAVVREPRRRFAWASTRDHFECLPKPKHDQRFRRSGTRNDQFLVDGALIRVRLSVRSERSHQ